MNITIEDMQYIYKDDDQKDFVVCAQLLTQTAPDVSQGIYRLCMFIKELEALDSHECYDKYAKVMDYYSSHGTLSQLALPLKKHKPSGKYQCALYKM